MYIFQEHVGTISKGELFAYFITQPRIFQQAIIARPLFK